jgi:hypothetical protein
MGPLLTRIKNWWSPAPVVTPEPEPKPQPEVVPDVPEPSRVQFVNYIRALLILRNAPFKELHAEFMKLPHKKIAYAVGTAIWVFMTYTFLKYLFGL